MKFNITEPIKNIYHMNFGKQKDLCETFMRFQEFFESPQFRGKFFSIKAYKDWYRKTSPKGKKTGRFTYNKDWSGFNIPSYILQPFKEGKFDPLSKKEKLFLKEFADKDGRFYIIGTFGSINLSTLAHEMAHALFYTESTYREKMIKLINNIPEKDLKKIHDHLGASGGYHPEVFEDETHAYVTINMEQLEKRHKISSEELWDIHRKMKRVFERYRSK